MRWESTQKALSVTITERHSVIFSALSRPSFSHKITSLVFTKHGPWLVGIDDVQPNFLICLQTTSEEKQNSCFTTEYRIAVLPALALCGSFADVQVNQCRGLCALKMRLNWISSSPSHQKLAFHEFYFHGFGGLQKEIQFFRKKIISRVSDNITETPNAALLPGCQEGGLASTFPLSLHMEVM